MRIMEEPVRQQAPFTSNGTAIAAKEPDRAGIEMAVLLFQRKGGKIQQYNSKGDVIIDNSPVIVTDPARRARTKTAYKECAPITLIPYKNRANFRSKHGQNIRKTGEYYWVQIGALELGRGQKWDYKTAIETRDKQRAIAGMPPAEY